MVRTGEKAGDQAGSGRKPEAMTVLQRLYNSEINFEISAFYEDDFLVKLGDELNGYQAEGRCRTWADVEEWLAGMARIH
jgi:hypothetical protein